MPWSRWALLRDTGRRIHSPPEAKTGSVIFCHVDGTGVAHWQMARMVLAGPDGEINWDRLPHTAVYRGHAEDVLTPSSNAGATMHAYGVKAPHRAFGTDAEGQPRVGAVGSAAQHHAGSGRRAGSRWGWSIVAARRNRARRFLPRAWLSVMPARKLCRSWWHPASRCFSAAVRNGFLPAGMEGRHGKGERQDGRNLVQEAEAAGYRVVYTREEMFALPGRRREGAWNFCLGRHLQR